MTTQAPTHPAATHASPLAKKLVTGTAIVAVVVAAVVVVFLRVHRHHSERTARHTLEEERDKGERVRVTRVGTSAAARELTLPGDVRGYNQATVYAKVSGYVRDVRVQRGQRVKRGEILATIESPENERDVTQARHDFDLAQSNARRYQALAPSGVVSQQDRETATTQAHVTRAMLLRAQDLLAYTIVRAPFDGIVSARYVDPGALVPAATGSTQSALPLVDVADVSTVRVFVYVGQDAAPFIRVGDPVEVWQDELPDRRIPAKVTEFTGALDPRTRTMQVEVDIPNATWGLQPGTFAHVTLRVAEPPAPLVPDEAIVVRDGKTEVAVIEDGKAHYADVDVGYNDGENVRILRGLRGGETIGASVPVEVEEGARVQPIATPDGG